MVEMVHNSCHGLDILSGFAVKFVVAHWLG